MEKNETKKKQCLANFDKIKASSLEIIHEKFNFFQQKLDNILPEKNAQDLKEQLNHYIEGKKVKLEQPIHDLIEEIHRIRKQQFEFAL